MGLYLAVIIPLVVIILLAVFFYRLFAKNMNRDEAYRNRLKELDELKHKGDFREARIISARSEGQSNTSPANRFVNLRFEIKETNGEFKMLSARWYVDTYYLSQLQPDSNIQVKVYDKYVFPLIDGARLEP